jgi:putative SOS response-associated peptidase YedK
MCGAYGFSVKDAWEVYNRFDIVNTLEYFKPRWNIRPGQMNPVITAHSPNKIFRMFWGLNPHFAKDVHYKYKTINAKAETVAQLPTFREPLKTKRCLVPATGFYEPDKKSRSTPPYTWHYFELKSKELFAFAGLYDILKEKELKNGKLVEKEGGKMIVSYTIITTVPNWTSTNVAVTDRHIYVKGAARYRKPDQDLGQQILTQDELNILQICMFS